MPRGYIVDLGSDYILNAGDAITDSWGRFRTDQVLGTGEWSFSGTDNGTTYTDEVEPGTFYLGTNGNVYFVPDYGQVDTVTTASSTAAPFYSENNTVQGTGADDLIDENFVDNQGDSIDSGDGVGPGGFGDRVEARPGDDTVDAGQGNDTVFGEQGNDSIFGNVGDDVLYGDGHAGGPEALNWSAEGGDGTDLSGGFTQDTGDMEVTVTFTDLGNNNPTSEVDTGETIYRSGTETLDDQSALLLFGNGDGATSRTTIDFAAGADSSMEDEVENVVFRLNDVDWAAGNHRDIVTVNAYDADGNPVPVTLTVTVTGSNDDTVSGNTVTAGDSSETASDATGSVLVEIAGPVAEIVIDYENGLGGTQGIWVSDVHFDTIAQADGDDTIEGGDGDDILYGGGGGDLLQGDDGADTVFGEDGNDTITVAEGDSVSGGDGDDLFVLADLGEGGTGDIFITGNEGGETNGDTLDLGGVADWSTLNLTTNEPGELAGTVELYDGSLVTFENIENIICFTPGTRIRTPFGDRAIEDLRPGDLVLTRDNGPQPLRWVGQRRVAATGRFAPVRIDPALLAGADAPLLVSPQHRMLWTGARAQLLFGTSEVLVSACHLLDNPAARRIEGGAVTYIHLMFDQHEIITANGAPTESFFPGDTALGALDPAARDEMFALFPELRSHCGAFGETARQCVRAHEARVLIA